MKLSISIVAYNNYEDIKNAIVSIEKYTSPVLTKQVFIIDNGVSVSTSENVEKFKCFLNDYQDIKYIDAGSNIGFGKGHNKILNVLNLSLIHI